MPTTLLSPFVPFCHLVVARYLLLEEGTHKDKAANDSMTFFPLAEIQKIAMLFRNYGADLIWPRSVADRHGSF